MPATKATKATLPADPADLRAKLTTLLDKANPDKPIKPTTLRTYVHNVVIIMRALAADHGEPLVDSTKYFIDPAYYQRVPAVIRAIPTESEQTATTRFNAWLTVLNRLAKHHEAASPRLAAAYQAAADHAYPHWKAAKEATQTAVTSPTYQTKDMQQNYVPYRALVKKAVEELMPAFHDLVGQGRLVGSAVDQEKHDRGLCAWLNLVEANQRSVLGTCQLAFDDSMPEGDGNALLVPRDSSKPCLLRVEEDKVDGHTPAATWELLPETGKILRDSYKIWPRLWVFCRDEAGDAPMGSTAYQRLVQDAFQVGARRPGINVLRHSLVIHIHSAYLGNIPVQQEWAKKMRHGHAAAVHLYNKCVDGAAPSPGPHRITGMGDPDLEALVGNREPEQLPSGVTIAEEEAEEDVPLTPPQPPQTRASSSKRPLAAPAKTTRGNPMPLDALRAALQRYNSGGTTPPASSVRANGLYKEPATGRWRSTRLVTGG